MPAASFIPRAVAFCMILCSASAILAGEHLRREPKLHGLWRKCPYTRESNHGLIHYPCATYWTSGHSIDRWDAGGPPSSFGYGITPSPWAYHSIAPYPHHYRSSNGTGWGDHYDCRN